MARNWSYITVCTWWNPCKLVLQTLFFLCCITTRMSYSSCTFKIYVGLRTNYKLVKEDNTPHSTCTCCMILPDSQLKGAYDIVSQNAGKILDNKISLWAQTNVSCSKTPKGTRTPLPPPQYVHNSSSCLADFHHCHGHVLKCSCCCFHQTNKRKLLHTSMTSENVTYASLSHECTVCPAHCFILLHSTTTMFLNLCSSNTHIPVYTLPRHLKTRHMLHASGIIL